MDEPRPVEIQDVETHITVTDGVGPLGKDEVQRIVDLVVRHLRRDAEMTAQREKDTAIANRVYPPHVR